MIQPVLHVLVVCLLLVGCGRLPMPWETEPSDTTIEDIRILPQNAFVYLDPNLAYREMATPNITRFKEDYYRVFHEHNSSQEARKWAWNVFTTKASYGENYRRRPPEWFRAMAEEADWEAMESIGKPGIALETLNLRAMPTNKPLFLNPKLAGEGFPFDYLQNSLVNFAEPLWISHTSRNGRWLFVYTAYASGWIGSEQAAYLSSAQINTLKMMPLAAMLRDGIPFNVNESYLFTSRLGMVLPVLRQGTSSLTLQLPCAKAADGTALFSTIEIPRPLLTPIPMPMTPHNIAKLANEMLGNPYGWGGLYGHRDCSSTLRDLFMPFGFWLPRNSFQQSSAGRSLDLSTMNPQEKTAYIETYGQPFATLLYLKGHIMLYLGHYRNEPVVLQTLWGIPTESGGVEGRKIVGQTAITTLNPGHELAKFDETKRLIGRIETMTYVGK